MKLLFNPIRKFVPDGGLTSIFRKIGFIGDSLSSGEFVSHSEEKGTNYHDYYEYSWGQFIARKCGLEAFNFSRGGLTAKAFFDFVNNHPDKRFHTFDKDNICQAYVIALGVNDIHHLNELYKDGFGSLKDVDMNNPDNNKDSFVGYYTKIIQKLRKFSPKCRIFLVDIPNHKPIGKLEKELDLKLRDVLYELSNVFEFTYVIDLYKYAPIYDKKFERLNYLDGHMSPAGYKFTADMIATYIDYIIRKQPEDFTQVGFINKDFHHDKYKW